jgi:hypothetical protein
MSSCRADSSPNVVRLPPSKACTSNRLLHPLADVVSIYNVTVCLYETEAWMVALDEAGRIHKTMARQIMNAPYALRRQTATRT